MEKGRREKTGKPQMTRILLPGHVEYVLSGAPNDDD